jgi:hypothetical protein
LKGLAWSIVSPPEIADLAQPQLAPPFFATEPKKDL